MRVEALPVPSEHIPTLLERVRPIYLSRTYGIPLPESDDQATSPRWDAEVFLDKLARLKGRLLKGGEPDIEGVAKIVLSDWVRGRIPYFVEPPERPADPKGKGKMDPATVKGKERAIQQDPKRKELGVKQKLRGIIQKNSFVGDDVRAVEGDNEQEEDAAKDINMADEVVSERASQDDEDELVWGDVFPEDGQVPTDAVEPLEGAHYGQSSDREVSDVSQLKK